MRYNTALARFRDNPDTNESKLTAGIVALVKVADGTEEEKMAKYCCD